MIEDSKKLIYLDDAFEAVVDLSGQATTKSAYAAFWKAGNELKKLPIVPAKEAVSAQWQKQWCDSSMIGHEYEECPICGCMILDTEKFWDCNFCPNCGTVMDGKDSVLMEEAD
jgi:hypothetical protein